MAGRRLSADEAALWARVMATVTPLPSRHPQIDIGPINIVLPPPRPARARPALPKPIGLARSAPPPILPPQAAPRPGTTLDASWDRRLVRGTVEPDATVDLHGHTLTSAYAMLDAALERSRTRGDRVILLVTGKPPRRDSERPHARGAIRAAVGDWLHASRHAGTVAAVRGASPRHGGSGALYIVLRRPRTTPNS